MYATPAGLSATPATFAGTLYDWSAGAVCGAVARFPGRRGLHLTLHRRDPARPDLYSLWRVGGALASRVPGFPDRAAAASMLADPPGAILADGARS